MLLFCQVNDCCSERSGFLDKERTTGHTTIFLSGTISRGGKKVLHLDMDMKVTQRNNNVSFSSYPMTGVISDDGNTITTKDEETGVNIYKRER
jgi:hypothetical protein